MDIDLARHRPGESDAAGRTPESFWPAWPRQQPADAGLADPAADLQYALGIHSVSKPGRDPRACEGADARR